MQYRLDKKDILLLVNVSTSKNETDYVQSMNFFLL